MKAVFIVDFELFDDRLKREIALFRRQISPHIPVLWTITSEDSQKPGRENGFYHDRDRIFTKPDVDASFETAVDHNGTKLMSYLSQSRITEGYVCGATYYGCILGGVQSLQSIRIAPAIVRDLTDFDDLEDYEHAEAASDFARCKIPVIDSRQALAALSAPPSFKPTP